MIVSHKGTKTPRELLFRITIDEQGMAIVEVDKAIFSNHFIIL